MSTFNPDGSILDIRYDKHMVTLITMLNLMEGALLGLADLSNRAKLDDFEARLKSVNLRVITFLDSQPVAETTKSAKPTTSARRATMLRLIRRVNDGYLVLLVRLDGTHHAPHPHPSSLPTRSALRQTIAMFNQRTSPTPAVGANNTPTAASSQVACKKQKKAKDPKSSELEEMRKAMLAVQAISDAKWRKEVGGLAGMLEKQKAEAEADRVAHKLQLATDQRRSSALEGRLDKQDRIIKDLVIKLVSQGQLLATLQQSGRVDVATEPDSAKTDNAPAGKSTGEVSSGQAELSKGALLEAGMGQIREAVSGVLRSISNQYLVTISSMAELEAAALRTIDEAAAGQLALIEVKADKLDRTMLEFERCHPTHMPLAKPHIDIIPNSIRIPISIRPIQPISPQLAHTSEQLAGSRFVPDAAPARFNDGPYNAYHALQATAVGSESAVSDWRAKVGATDESGFAKDGARTIAQGQSGLPRPGDAILLEQVEKLMLSRAAAKQLVEAEAGKNDIGAGDVAEGKENGAMGVNKEETDEENAKEKSMERGKA